MAYDIHYRKPTAQFYLLIVGIVVVLGLAFWFFWNNTNSASKIIDPEKYQAVYLTDGNYYYGKLTDKNDEYFQLTDVYYLTQGQAGTESEGGAGESTKLELVTLSSMVHSPENQMTILKDHVVFFENIKSDGDVAKIIQDIKNTNAKN